MVEMVREGTLGIDIDVVNHDVDERHVGEDAVKNPLEQHGRCSQTHR